MQNLSTSPQISECKLYSMLFRSQLPTASSTLLRWIPCVAPRSRPTGSSTGASGAGSASARYTWSRTPPRGRPRPGSSRPRPNTFPAAEVPVIEVSKMTPRGQARSEALGSGPFSAASLLILSRWANISSIDFRIRNTLMHFAIVLRSDNCESNSNDNCFLDLSRP